MKNLVRILSIVMVLAICLGTVAFAVDPTSFSGKTINNSKINNIGNTVIGTLQVVATVVAVAVLLFVGIKFLLASPSEKANIKGMLIPYVIGAVLIFAAVPILGIFKSLASGI